MTYSSNPTYYNRILGIETKDIPEGKDLWMYAYKEDERALNLLCKPTRCKVIHSISYEYKADGKSLRKNGVSMYSRFFTDTYEEAVEGFNYLVKKRLDRLQTEMNNTQQLLIIVEDNK